MQRPAGLGVFRDCGRKPFAAALWSVWKEERPGIKLDTDRSFF